MRKVIVSILLIAVIGVVIYFTFVIATIKIAVGSILLGISAISLLLVWILWKTKRKDD